MRNRQIANVALVIISCAIGLGLTELALRALPEIPVLPDYRTTWRKEGLGPGGFLQENFEARVQDGFGGTVRWRNNSQGFRNDREFAIPAPPGTIRILSMGDSFTGGYRVGQHATFSYLLEKRLQDDFPLNNIEVMISVVEEPATGLLYALEKGMQFRPDVILLGLTLGNDIAQLYSTLYSIYSFEPDREPMIRGISPNGDQSAWPLRLRKLTIPEMCLRSKALAASIERPKWCQLNAHSCSSLRTVQLLERLITRGHLDDAQTVVSDSEEYEHPRLFESHGLGILLSPKHDDIEKAYYSLFHLMDGWSRFAKTNGVELIIVLFPQRYQVQPQDWRRTIEVYNLNKTCFDVYAANRRILDYCMSAGLRCVDPTSDLAKVYSANRKSLYLPRNDMHWNAAGHAEIARILAPTIRAVLCSPRTGDWRGAQEHDVRPPLVESPMCSAD
jgi:hypothetical protein